MKDIMMLLRKDIKEKMKLSDEFSHEIYDDVMTGMKKISDNPPKVLVIDLGISRLSGMDCLTMIRSNPKYHHTKVIVTAKAYNKKLAMEAFNSGADYYVKLPLEDDIIKKILDLRNIEESFFEL